MPRRFSLPSSLATAEFPLDSDKFWPLIIEINEMLAESVDKKWETKTDMDAYSLKQIVEQLKINLERKYKTDFKSLLVPPTIDEIGAIDKTNWEEQSGRLFMFLLSRLGKVDGSRRNVAITDAVRLYQVILDKIGVTFFDASAMRRPRFQQFIEQAVEEELIPHPGSTGEHVSMMYDRLYSTGKTRGKEDSGQKSMIYHIQRLTPKGLNARAQRGMTFYYGFGIDESGADELEMSLQNLERVGFDRDWLHRIQVLTRGEKVTLPMPAWALDQIQVLRPAEYKRFEENSRGQ